MIYWLRKNAGKIMAFTLIAFVGGIFFVGLNFAGRGGKSSNKQARRAEANELATINGDPINIFKYSQLMRRFVAQVQASGQEVDPYMHAALEYNALNQTIEYHLTLLKAKQERVRVSGSELKQQLNAIAQSNKMTMADLKAHLATQGYPFDRFKDDIRNEIIISKFMREKEGSVQVTDQDLELSLTRLRASHILIADQDPDKALQQANEVLAKVQAGADFAETAKQYSADTASAKQGGDIGWFAQGQMVPEFEKAAFTLNPGQIYGEPVKTQFGYHIVKLLDFRKLDLPPNVDATAYRQDLLERKKAAVVNSLIKEVRDNAKIEVVSESHLAYKLQTEGKLTEAIVLYKKLANENPKSYVPYVFIGDLYAKMNRFSDAFENYARAEAIQELNPQGKNSLVSLSKALAFIRQGEVAGKSGKATDKQIAFRKAGQELIKAREQAGNKIAIYRALKQNFEIIGMTRDARQAEQTIVNLERLAKETSATDQSGNVASR